MYLTQHSDGTVKAYPHKLRIALRDKVKDLLGRYPLDQVLSEIADQKPAYHIRTQPAVDTRVDSRIDTPVPAFTPSPADQPDRDQPDQGKPDKADKVDKVDKPAKTDKNVKADKSDETPKTVIP